MLRFVITNTDGSETELKKALTVSLNSEIGVPADSLVLTLPYDRKLSESADFISAFSGDKLVFKGKLDQIINIKEYDGVITKLTARSPAGTLLDSEAEPITYFDPAAPMIFERHLAPFGFTEYDADNVPFFGRLRIDKGMTHWQVLRAFCKIRYGVEPFITGGGKVFFRGYGPDKKIVFGGNDGETAYYSARESCKRCKIISQIKLKLTESGAYSSVLNNPNPKSREIKRIRYVNAAADNTSVETADKMIAQSNLDSYGITLECLGCCTDIIGCSAEINDKIFGRISGLVVSGLSYTLNSGGEKTTVILRKERF